MWLDVLVISLQGIDLGSLQSTANSPILSPTPASKSSIPAATVHLRPQRPLARLPGDVLVHHDIFFSFVSLWFVPTSLTVAVSPQHLDAGDAPVPPRPSRRPLLVRGV
jgi:hypothetical protein